MPRYLVQPTGQKRRVAENKNLSANLEKIIDVTPFMRSDPNDASAEFEIGDVEIGVKYRFSPGNRIVAANRHLPHGRASNKGLQQRARQRQNLVAISRLDSESNYALS